MYNVQIYIYMEELDTQQQLLMCKWIDVCMYLYEGICIYIYMCLCVCLCIHT